MIFDVEIQPTNGKTFTSQDVFKMATKADIVSFKQEEDAENVKYRLQFRDHADKTKVDNVLQSFEKLGCQVNVKEIQNSPTKLDKQVVEKLTHKTSSTASSNKSAKISRPKSA